MKPLKEFWGSLGERTSNATYINHVLVDRKPGFVIESSLRPKVSHCLIISIHTLATILASSKARCRWFAPAASAQT